MATRISKTVASEVAKAMAADTIGKKRPEAKKALLAFANELRKQNRALNPKVAAAYAEIPDYFNVTQSVYFACDGLRQIYIYGVEEYPIKTNGNCTVVVDREAYETLLSLSKAVDELEREEHTLRRKLESTLYALKNLKRVEADFPEALPYFPEESKAEGCTTVALPISELRNTLVQYL